MTIGQVIMYHNLGIEIKYPAPKEPGKRTLADMSVEERKEALLAARAAFKADEVAEREKQNEEAKAEYRDRYGEV